MSVRKLTASLFMALAMLGVGNNTAQAQEYFPVADPFAFDPDFRWFEPIYDADLADMKPKKRANTGWYATYDRLNLYGSRPELVDLNASETKLDSGWGHRYELGYMLPADDNGWQFNWTSLDVNQSFIIEQERLNRINLQNIGGAGAGGGGGGAQPIDPRFPGDGRFTIPAEDRNTPGEFRRVYFVRDSENVFDFNSYELNKTWRTEPYHYGGILEPLVGFRWMRFSDDNTRQDYNTIISIDPFFPGAAEQLITDTVITDNELLTGQVGFRYTKFRDRFTFASDFRVFTGGSLQCATTTRTIDTTIYGGTTVAVGTAPDINQHEATVPKYDRNEEFVIGFDVRGEVNYQLTKMITLRAGFQVIDLATGIWRGGPGPVNGTNIGTPTGGDRDQDVVMAGGTFGITLNR